MADSIPPFVWLGVGAVVVVVSLLMSSLRLFVIVGVVFILWGIGSLYRGRKDTPAVAQGHTYHTKAPHVEGKQRCFVCGSLNSPKANFCGHCGHRLN